MHVCIPAAACTCSHVCTCPQLHSGPSIGKASTWRDQAPGGSVLTGDRTWHCTRTRARAFTHSGVTPGTAATGAAVDTAGASATSARARPLSKKKCRPPRPRRAQLAPPLLLLCDHATGDVNSAPIAPWGRVYSYCCSGALRLPRRAPHTRLRQVILPSHMCMSLLDGAMPQLRHRHMQHTHKRL